MSKLPKKAIDEFKKIYKETKGIELTNEQAELKAEQLMRLFYVLLKDNLKSRKQQNITPPLTGLELNKLLPDEEMQELDEDL